MQPPRKEEYKGIGKFDYAVTTGGIFALMGINESWAKSINKTFTGVAELSTRAHTRIAVILGAAGALLGYASAKIGENQFNQNQEALGKSAHELQLAEQKISHLNTLLADKDQQLAQSEKRFADSLQSRKHHGSHVDAAIADAEKAETLEAAR